MDVEVQAKATSGRADLGLNLIVSMRIPLTKCDEANRFPQSSDDIIYEQDIIRDPASIKPWLRYINHKYQYGTILERAFVCYGPNPKLQHLPNSELGSRARMLAPAEIVQAMED
ncbi:MAG: hypothetical protein Q9174_007388, partial [Haloplaca sp. 1 TL-2023]